MKRQVGIVSLISAMAVTLNVPLGVEAADAPPHLVMPILQYESEQAAERLNERMQAPMATDSAIAGSSSITKHSKSMATLPVDAVSFPIHHIMVTSKDSHFKRYGHALSAFEGQHMGQQGLEIVTKHLQEKVLADGYITSRVIVPNQDLRTGTLQLEILPGYIEDIRYKEPHIRGNWRAAFPTKPGNLLRRQELE